MSILFLATLLNSLITSQNKFGCFNFYKWPSKVVLVVKNLHASDLRDASSIPGSG